MKKADKIISVIILGLPAPALLALLLWWGGVLLSIDIEGVFPFLVLAGVAAGVVLDATALRSFIFSLFALPVWVLLFLEAFYSVMAYGVFMGFPVPCCLAGIIGSYIVLRRGVLKKSPQRLIKQSARTANAFSFGLLFALCACTAVLSLNEATLGSQLKSMFGLAFTVEAWMIWLLIVAGGVSLLAFQYFASKLIERAMLKRSAAA